MACANDSEFCLSAKIGGKVRFGQKKGFDFSHFTRLLVSSSKGAKMFSYTEKFIFVGMEVREISRCFVVPRAAARVLPLRLRAHAPPHDPKTSTPDYI